MDLSEYKITEDNEFYCKKEITYHILKNGENNFEPITVKGGELLELNEPSVVNYPSLLEFDNAKNYVTKVYLGGSNNWSKEVVPSGGDNFVNLINSAVNNDGVNGIYVKGNGEANQIEFRSNDVLFIKVKCNEKINNYTARTKYNIYESKYTTVSEKEFPKIDCNE